MKHNCKKILGLRFFSGTTDDAVLLTHKGGLILAPSGPGLATLSHDLPYKTALENADMVLVDSGYLALLCRIFLRKRLTRISGYKFLEALLADHSFQTSNGILWVNPTPEEDRVNREFLTGEGFSLNKDSSYIAPLYDQNNIEDSTLLKRIQNEKPDYVILNIAGNIQEPLGYYLKRNLDYTPAIICTGAAIAFITGQQAGIPDWADRLFLGWLARCVAHPLKFIPRYIKAASLALLVMKYGENSVRSRGRE